MHKETLSVTWGAVPVTWVHTLVIGSGAAGLNAAVQLHAQGVHDTLIVTEGLHMGTSINTGSDKQTYYKLSLYGDEADSPRAMAETYFAGGSMHGDLALVEASLSVRAFAHLVNLGLPFPTDAYGQFVGYKTDHDPRQRATSIGPYTSQEMCRALIRRVRELGIEVREGRNVVQLLTLDDGDGQRVAGAVVLGPAIGKDSQVPLQELPLEIYAAENVILAVGGPGGLYQASVYPRVHSGAIGLALMAGARAQSLPESQYGLASIGFRWNVSGTYMQAIPRLVSTAADGISDEREFLGQVFDSPGAQHSCVFLKGYQWPFDARKAIGGSSLIDILVHIETVIKARRVYLDYRRNPAGFRFEDLNGQAREYLARSQVVQARTPLERLENMNPAALETYRAHGIDLGIAPLEIAVCAQHNNGGLAANHWWESTNVRHLFPVGEVNGSHGVYRPGGSALNAGQVGGFRAAEWIAHRYPWWSVSEDAVRRAARQAAAEIRAWIARCAGAPTSWQKERAAFQARMTRAGAHIRSIPVLKQAVTEAWAQWAHIKRHGCAYATPDEAAEALRNRQLCLAHAVYLEAILFGLRSGVGSRGSAIVLDPAGAAVHERLGKAWRLAPEDPAFRDQVLETVVLPGEERPQVENRWVPRRPIPAADAWFETAWARFREGTIYDE
jgi:succinate dehydrogenase/fumarate reductase flavoprotein subunit